MKTLFHHLWLTIIPFGLIFWMAYDFQPFQVCLMFFWVMLRLNDMISNINKLFESQILTMSIVNRFVFEEEQISEDRLN